MSTFTSIQAPSGVWIRILGFYETRESAMKTIPLREQHDQGEIRICKTNEFKLLMRNTPTITNRQYECDKLQVLLDKNKTWYNEKEQELKKRSNNEFIEEELPAEKNTKTIQG